MADRFPSLEEFGEGESSLVVSTTWPDSIADQTAPPVSNGNHPTDSAGEDFLTRERAALGDDAALFASSNDNAATVQDGNDDLLGGGESYNGAQHDGEEITEFKSSYPAVDTHNDVSWPADLYSASKR